MRGEMPSRLRIGGEVYRFYVVSRSKKGAASEAAKQRRMGYKARVVDYTRLGWWGVYRRRR